MRITSLTLTPSSIKASPTKNPAPQSAFGQKENLCTSKTSDTVLFGGPSQKKTPFSLKEPPEGYAITNASTSEISEMVDFIEKIFGKTGARPAYEASCRHALEQGGYSYIIRSVTTPGKPIIGTTILNPNGYIALGAVDKTHQGKGIAAAMMAGLVEKSKQAGMDKLHLGVEKSNPDAEVAIRVAQKAGFKQTGENQELWLMELGLKQQAPLAKPGRDISRPTFSRNGIQAFPRRGAPNILSSLRALKRFFH